MKTVNVRHRNLVPNLRHAAALECIQIQLGFDISIDLSVTFVAVSYREVYTENVKHNYTLSSAATGLKFWN